MSATAQSIGFGEAGPSIFALLGAPNCGKTVLFNGLTGSHAKVANYPGVTVDKREGKFVRDANIRIIDLPGTYSLRTTSPDEAVARDMLLGRYGSCPDAIIAVADATNLRMTLRMMLELKTLGLPMVVSLNLSDVAQARGLKIDAAKLSKLLDVPVLETVAIRRDGIRAVEEAVAKLPRHFHGNIDPDEAMKVLNGLDSNALYEQVEDILSQVVKTEMNLPAWHRKLDRIVLHPFWGMVILLSILMMVFQAVYTWAQPVMDLIQGLFDSLGAWVAEVLPEGLLSDLLVNGVIAGTGSVLVFLPQIAILFAFILLLEDSGYLPRAAFLLDNLLSRTGLSGRSFIPLLSSFACAVPAVMSARTIQDPRERLVTIAIAPMLTCSARLPVYALIIAAVIPNRTVMGVFNLQGRHPVGCTVGAGAEVDRTQQGQRAAVPAAHGAAHLPHAQLQAHRDQPVGPRQGLPGAGRYRHLLGQCGAVGAHQLPGGPRGRHGCSHRLQPGRHPGSPAATHLRPVGLHLADVHCHDPGHRSP